MAEMTPADWEEVAEANADDRINYITVTTDQLDLGDPRWDQVVGAIEEFLSTHPDFHDIAFAVEVDDA